jgi:hypothetical protein
MSESNHRHMARVEYYHDVAAPQALELCPAAFAIVRNGLGQVLLVRCYPSPLADPCLRVPARRTAETSERGTPLSRPELRTRVAQ